MRAIIIADGRSTRGEYWAVIKSCSKVARTENPSGKVTEVISPGRKNIPKTWETQFSPPLYRERQSDVVQLL